MIRLVDVLRTQGIPLGHYKVHLATGENPTPLEAYLGGSFKEWQENQTKKNFQCEMVIGLIHLGSDRWLFAGVYRILGVREGTEAAFRYDTELLPGQVDLIGRIIVKYRREYRASYIWGHGFGNQLEVAEILESALSIEEFPGYTDVIISHSKLKLISEKEEPSWKSALSSVNGVYLVMDKETGRHYVGSATGEGGLWQRWHAYAETGHGGNSELKAE